MPKSYEQGIRDFSILSTFPKLVEQVIANQKYNLSCIILLFYQKLVGPIVYIPLICVGFISVFCQKWTSDFNNNWCAS